MSSRKPVGIGPILMTGANRGVGVDSDVVRREVWSAVTDPTVKGLPCTLIRRCVAAPISTHRFESTACRKCFGSIVAVDHLNLTVAPGEVFGFLGPNGSGKSTTIRLMLGLLRPSAGTAQIFGVAADDVRQTHRHLAYVPADVALWPTLTGAEILELLGNIGPGVDTEYRAELVDRFELDLDRPGKTYSTGNRQKVSIVAAFATRAPLLVLDEPTSGLDPLMEREFRSCVMQARERGQTVFLSSHQLSEVEAVCDRVGILRAGRLVEIDSVADLRRLRRTVVDVRFAGAKPLLDNIVGISNFEQLDGQRRPVQPFRTSGACTTCARGGRCDRARDARTDTRGDFPRLLRHDSPMTSATVPSRAAVVAPTAPGRPVAWLAVRQIRRGALIVTAVCAGMSALVAYQYQTTFQGSIDATGLRALTENPAIRILFGPPVALDDAGGFTVWRTGLPVLVLSSVWSLLCGHPHHSRRRGRRSLRSAACRARSGRRHRVRAAAAIGVLATVAHRGRDRRSIGGRGH